MDRISPTKDRYWVQADTPETKVGSIVLPDSSKEPPTTGVVLAAGQNDAEITEGTRIMFSRYCGVWIEGDPVNGGKVLLHTDDLMATIGEDE